MSKTCTPLQAALALRTTPYEVARLIRDGKLEAHRKNGRGEWAIPVESLRDYAATMPNRWISLVENPQWSAQAACHGLCYDFDTTWMEDPSGINFKHKPKGVTPVYVIKTWDADTLTQRIKQARKDYKTQLAICAQCPVRRDCLADTVSFELYQDDKHTTPGRLLEKVEGIRGGTHPLERIAHYTFLVQDMKQAMPPLTVQAARSYLDWNNHPALTSLIRMLKERQENARKPQ